MSGKLKNSRKRRPDRPFDPALLDKARRIAARYQIILKEEDGEYYGRALELPNAMEDGATPDECVRKTREILTTAVAVMLEDGESPPPPAADGIRTEQVNVRLTAEEKLRLEESARQAGFRGVSDYVRAVALAT